MLLKLLKLFGLDVAAEIEAAKTSLERRAERAADRIRRIAEGAAVIAALGVLATITAIMTLTVGLIALYRLVAQAYGDYAGLGADAAILVVMTAALAAVIFAKAQRLASVRTATRETGDSFTSGITELSESRSATQATQASAPPTPPPADHVLLPVRSPAAPRDLIDPLAVVLSEVIQVPRLGNPVVDDLIGKIRTTARSSAEEAVYRAADVIRRGRPADLVLVLTGTAALAWLITRNARSRP